MKKDRKCLFVARYPQGRWAFLPLLLCWLALGSCDEQGSSATLVSIEVTAEGTAASQSLAKGTTLQLAATGVYSDKSVVDIGWRVSWTSANSAAAAVSSQGLVTALTPGTAEITASLGGISGQTTITVTPTTLVSLAINPISPAVAKGTREQFTATGTFTDASVQNLTTQVTWSSSSLAVATVDGQGLATALSPGTTAISATFGDKSVSTALMVTAATLESIAVTPASSAIAKGVKQQFTAMGTYSDGTTQSLTTLVTWASADMSVATISNAAGTQGLASGVGAGSTTISATLGGKTGSAMLTVTSATLVAIAVTPPSASIAKGTKQQLTATGTYSDSSTQNLTAMVTWSSSDPTIATISNAAGLQGLATATGVGSATLSATLGGKSGSATLTVTSATLVSIAVTPPSASLAKGTKQQFTATGTYGDGTTQDLTTMATWASADVTISAISNVAGSQGLATGVGAGSTTISATVGGKSGSATLTVTAASLLSLAVTPVMPAIANGTKQQFTATAAFSDGATQDVTTMATWASMDSTVATISNAAGTQGQASAVKVGTVTISATLSGKTSSTTLTVTAATLVALSVTPPSPTVTKGSLQQFTATGTYSDGSTQSLTTTVTWVSSDLSVATISNGAGSQGLAVAAAVGVTTISATLGGKVGSATLNVTAGTLVSIAVTPSSAAIKKGMAQQFTATGTNSDGSTQNLTALVTWASADPLTATVSNAAGTQGLATGGNVGTSIITATLSGKSGSATLTVTASTLVSIVVTPASPAIVKGTKQQFTATGTYSDGSTQNLTTMGTWTSSDATLAAISNAAGSQGQATGLSLGTVTITATFSGTSGSTTLTVTTPALSTITINPTGATIAKGTNQKFTATGTYADGSSQDITQLVTWASSDLSTATVSNAAGAQGLCTGVAVGTSAISATLGGKSAMVALRVTAATVVSFTIAPTNASIVLGGSLQFTATGTFSDGSIEDITTVVTWDSAGMTVVAISNAAGKQGLASGLLIGTTTISATWSGKTVSTSAVVWPGLRPSGTPATGTDPRGIAVGDFNGDGKLDLVTANMTGASISVLLGDGAGTFAAPIQTAATGKPRGVVVRDFNGDGKLDLVTANSVASVSVFLGDGTGSFAAEVKYAVASAPGAVVVGDFNGDGKLDLATANYSANNVGVLLGTGTGSFVAAVNFAAGSHVADLVTADFNGDGKLDLVVPVDAGLLNVLIGDGAGSFAAPLGSAGGSRPSRLAVGDFNGDGKLDIATTDSFLSKVGVVLGNGLGKFGTLVAYLAGSYPDALVTGDFSQDGKLDLAVVDFSDSTVSVLVGDGTGSFVTAVSFPTGQNPDSLTMGDFNGDGKLDVAVGNSTSNDITVLVSK